MRIFCGGTQCGAYLGEVGISIVGMNPNPVWRIQPGWRWRFPAGIRDGNRNGILEKIDQDFVESRRLGHAVFGVVSATDQRVSVGREVNLPVVVRCPKCHRLRYVPPEVIARRTLLGA